MILPDFTDFTRFQSDFIIFVLFYMILHNKYMLTYKIVWFYELTRDFNNASIMIFSWATPSL
jgi:hypothetical protein